MVKGPWTIMAALALLASGCSSKTAPPRADKGITVAKTEPKAAAVAKKLARKDAGPDARVKPEESRAFFLREQHVLVPFLCYDAKAGSGAWGRRAWRSCAGQARARRRAGRAHRPAGHGEPRDGLRVGGGLRRRGHQGPAAEEGETPTRTTRRSGTRCGPTRRRAWSGSWTERR